MVETFNKKMTKSDIVESPKDEKLKGVIISIDKGLLSEFIDPSVHSKFDNLDQSSLRIAFEVKFNDRLIKGKDRISYYDEPLSNSKLGKFLERYGKLEVGQQIKVDYNSKGFGSILLE